MSLIDKSLTCSPASSHEESGLLAISYPELTLVKWDFSRLLGVYVAIFAGVSILWGRFIFKENIPPSTWLGLSVIVVGGLIIQSGYK